MNDARPCCDREQPMSPIHQRFVDTISGENVPEPSASVSEHHAEYAATLLHVVHDNS